jgi:integrase
MPTVSVLGLVADSFRRHRERQGEIMPLHEGRCQENNLVFPIRHGTPGDPRNTSQMKDELLERAGLPRIRFHDLRHTAPTLLGRMDPPTRYIMNASGHGQVQQTMRYTHVIRKAGHEIADRFDARFGGSLTNLGAGSEADVTCPQFEAHS